MYWDIIEVTPERNYHLFVRFKDGLAGRLRLQESEMTGALAPLRDVEFFKRVYIDYGALTWPGGIDLAPDAMYTRIAHERDKQSQAS